MVLARLPGGVLALVGDELGVVPFPHNIAVPVDLQQVELVLVGCRAAACARGAKDLTARQQLVREAAQTRPAVDLAAVHVDEQRAARGGEDGVAVIGTLFVVDECAGGMNARIAHE